MRQRVTSPRRRLRSRLSDAARAHGTDLSSVVRRAVMAYLESMSGIAHTLVPPHTPEDCLAVVVSHASPCTQSHLTAVLARLDRILQRQGPSRLWFVAEALAYRVAKAEARVNEASVPSPQHASRACREPPYTGGQRNGP